MEKVVSVLWRPPEMAKQMFADGLLQQAAPRMLELGAHKLRVCVDDDDVQGDALRRNPQPPPIAAIVSYWVECSEDRGQIESALTDRADRLASFLVVESRPLLNVDHLGAPGQRTPGMLQISCIVRKQGLSYDDFIRIWQHELRPCAVETQSQFQYIRNEIVRRLIGSSPPWAAIVEESYPIEAMSDPYVFFDAVGDEERFQANVKRLMGTASKMLDLDQTDVTIASEYVFDH
jgi:hypothetical protein